MSVEDSYKICEILKDTYNFYWINNYPELKDVFIETMDIYKKNPKKFPNTNKIFMSLLYNLVNPEYIPIVDYITGPGMISKWTSKKYKKTIYLFSENEHSNVRGCMGKVNLSNKKHTIIEKYIVDLVKSSPVFIDFYLEVGVMLDTSFDLEHHNPQQTVWDIYSVTQRCYGPLEKRDCPYNVRMHGIDARSIKSNKHSYSRLNEMSHLLMIITLNIKNGNKPYISLENFRIIFSSEIKLLSTIKTYEDLMEIVLNNIQTNTLVMKELERSTIPKKKILDFFLNNILKSNLSFVSNALYRIGKFFSLLRKNSKEWPEDMEKVSLILIVSLAVTMDVYTVSRIFKVFDVKESQHYPKEPQNIIYYAGSAHTKAMAEFLKELKFKRIEHSDGKIFSCVTMKGIKQPLFTL